MRDNLIRNRAGEAKLKPAVQDLERYPTTVPSPPSRNRPGIAWYADGKSGLAPDSRLWPVQILVQKLKGADAVDRVRTVEHFEPRAVPIPS